MSDVWSTQVWPFTFELRVGQAAPFPSTIPDTGASHHVIQDVMAFVPLVTHTVHHPFAGCANLFMCWNNGTWGTHVNKHFL